MTKKVLIIHDSSNKADDNLIDQLYKGCNIYFPSNKLSTTGVDMIKHNDTQIWLSKNLERFKSTTKSYFKGADLVVFSPNLSRENDIHTCKDMKIPYLILSKNDVQSNNVLNLIENYPLQPKVKLKKEITITSEVIQNDPPYPGDGPDLYSLFYKNDLNKSSQSDDLTSKQSLDK